MTCFKPPPRKNLLVSALRLALELLRHGVRKLDGRRKLDCFVQCAIERAVHRVNAVHPLHRLLYLLWRYKTHPHVNPADDQHTFLRFDLSGHIRGQLSIAGIDLARFQRTSEGTHHSTSGCGNHVVNGRGVRLFQLCWVNFVVLSNGSLDPESPSLLLSGQVGDAERSLLSFDARLRDINDITHGSLLSTLKKSAQFHRSIGYLC